MPNNQEMNCAENPNAPICQIYPLLFKSSSATANNNYKKLDSDHIVQVLFSAHSAEAAIYVLIVLIIYAIILVLLLHSSLGDKENSTLENSKQSLENLDLIEAQACVQQHGTSSQLINLGNGSKKLCTRSATQIIQENNGNSKTKCEAVRIGTPKSALIEDDDELIFSDQPEQVACFV